ncbi:tripartite tricarboxylate transporter TctB family protein [Faunimonas sp. B44]|uniref:tripartite tricarboxylate transporter TctB family protein n=1 Tax=Faunimonas sp. B44 TaxID=3461493 RepID=UPI004043DE5E
MTRDFYVGLVVLAGAVSYWLAAAKIPISFLDGAVTASTMPQTLAIVLGGLALLLMGQSVAARVRSGAAAAAAEGEEAPTLRQHGRAIGMLAIGIAYLVLLPAIGYLAAITLLLIVVAFYNGRRRAGPLIAFGVLGGAFYYALFTFVLRVPMPSGLWPGLIG